MTRTGLGEQKLSGNLLLPLLISNFVAFSSSSIDTFIIPLPLALLIELELIGLA